MRTLTVAVMVLLASSANAKDVSEYFTKKWDGYYSSNKCMDRNLAVGTAMTGRQSARSLLDANAITLLGEEYKGKPRSAFRTVLFGMTDHDREVIQAMGSVEYLFDSYMAFSGQRLCINGNSNYSESDLWSNVVGSIPATLLASDYDNPRINIREQDLMAMHNYFLDWYDWACLDPVGRPGGCDSLSPIDKLRFVIK